MKKNFTNLAQSFVTNLFWPRLENGIKYKLLKAEPLSSQNKMPHIFLFYQHNTIAAQYLDITGDSAGKNKCGNNRYPPGPNMSSSGIFRGKLIFFLNKKCLITKMRPGFFHKLPEPGEYDRVASAWYLGSLAGAEQKRRDEMFTGHWSDCCFARRIITSQRRKILLTRNIAHQISRAGWKEEKYIGISKKIS